MSAQLCDTSGSLQRLRLKQQGRLIPLFSLSSATSICFWRVSGVLTARIQRIQSQRASGVISFHKASAFGEAAKAFSKSSGTSGSIHSLLGSSATCTVSPAFTEASSSNFLSGLNQWLDLCPGAYLPSGSSKALKGAPLIVPETIVIPLDGSSAEALSGSLRMVRELILNSFVSKRIVGIFPHEDIISTPQRL
jgi:hypothetical protein